MKRTLVAAFLTAIMLGVSAVGFSEDEQRPPAAAPEAAAPAAGAKEAEQGGCMPGGGAFSLGVPGRVPGRAVRRGKGASGGP